MTTMNSDEPGSVQTRPTLLDRVKAGDEASWQEFDGIYRKVIRDFAIQANLSDSEADEAAQETMIGMARHLPQYKYEPKVCRFKTYLLNQAVWRIKDQLKKRDKLAALEGSASCRKPAFPGDDTSRTETINRVADPAATDLDALFEAEWRKNLLQVAIERVKEKFSHKQFQIFDLLAFQQWPAADVARALGVSIANVYVTRHCIAAAIKKETRRLEQKLEHQAEEMA